MSEEPDLLSLLYHVPVAIAQTDVEGNIALMNPLGCQLLMRISADPDFDNLFRTLAPHGDLQKLVQEFARPFGVVCDAYRLACTTPQSEVVHLEFTIHRLENQRYLIAFRDVTQVVINELRVQQSLRNLENLIKSIARLQVETSEVEIVLEPLLKQVSQWVGSDGAVLLRGQQGGNYDILIKVGKLLDSKNLPPLATEAFRASDQGSPESKGDVSPVLIGSRDYALLVNASSTQIDEESYYLLKLFVQAAAQALENAALQEKLVRNERLSAVGQAMGSVVHDLRSPIATIKTAIEMAEFKNFEPKVVTRMHAIVLRSVDSAFDLVNDVLDFVRDAPISESWQNLANLFESVHENCQAACDASGAKLLVSGGQFALRADQRKLVRALSNLVNNACDAVAGKPDGQISLSERSEPEWTVIEVRDNGGGIPEALRATLFEAFVTHGKAGGTGLGLAITRRIVRAHGGTIEVESGEAGTVFSIRLPRDVRATGDLTPRS